jgi:Ca-activated chloride channel family protein
MISLSFAPKKPALLADRDNELEVLLRVRADERRGARFEREPFNLSVVIDRSGSMSGRPLQEAVRCAEMIVDRLDSHDRLSIVTYDNTISVDVPSQKVADRSTFRSALRRIENGGTTDLHGGWLAGAEQTALHQGTGSLSRVLLLSDGCANVGVTDHSQIAKHCASLAEAGVQTSTYGLGHQFNEELMSRMARSGLGNAYYGQTAEDLMDPFMEEFDLLSELCARKLRLSLVPARGVTVEVLNGYPIDNEARSMLPDIAYGSEAWALLKLAVPSSVARADARSVDLLAAALTYSDLSGVEHSESARLKIETLPREAWEAVATDPAVVRRVTEVRAAAHQEMARTAARHGDWQRVESLLQQLRGEAADNPWLKASIDELEQYASARQTESFSKEAYYKAQKLRTRLADKAEDADWSMAQEGDKASFLRRKLEQGKRF